MGELWWGFTNTPPPVPTFGVRVRVRIRVSEVSWLKHVEGGRYKKMEDMSEEELRRRRVTRVTAAAKRGEKSFDIEPIEVRSCNGGVAQSCGSFTYLGSLTDIKGSSGPEIRRRIKNAGEAFRGAWVLWRMKGLSLKLKGRLYSAFVHSVRSLEHHKVGFQRS